MPKRDTNARKQSARAEAETREQQFRTLANSIPQLAWMADHEGYIFWYNDRWYDYTGTTLDEMEGWGWQKVHHPDEVARVVERIKLAFASGESWEDTFPLRSRSGQYRWFLSRALPIRDAHGQVVRWFGTNTDITEQLEMEKALRESEQQFRTLANSIPQLAWMADPQGYIFWYSDRWYEYTGTSLKEMEGWGWQKVHHPNEVARVVDRIKVAFATGEPWEDTFPLRSNRGEYRWFLSRALPIKDDNGSVVRWFGTNTDITEQRKLEQQLRESRDELEQRVAERTAELFQANQILKAEEERFRSLANAAPVLIWVSGMDKLRSWVNQKWLNFTDRTMEQEMGNRWAEGIHPDDFDRCLQAYLSAFDARQPFSIEYRLRRHDGHWRWILDNGAPNYGPDQEFEGYLGTCIDVTEQKINLQAVQESEQRFAKAFNANPQPMSLSTLMEGKYLNVNGSFLRMSGFTRDELIGHTSTELNNFETPMERTRLLVEPLLRSGGLGNIELKFQTRSGAVRTLLSSAELLELGGEKCILIASSDITERKALEQGLERSEREFSTLVENSPDIIARLDRNLHYIYMSPELERATGISPDQFIGKTSSQVPLEGYDWRNFEACCREAIAEKKAVHRAIEYGRRTYWTRIIPELTADGAVESVMTISQDVTDRMRAEKDLQQLTAQLFRLQDEERRRIARELHDGTAQNLFGISINLTKLNQMSGGTTEAKELIEECESLGNKTLQEIRTLSYLLHPPLLDEAGLVSALQWYVQGFTKRSGIYVDVYAEPIDRLAAEFELALFRIVQESLTNVRRHSGSETASIRLECKSGEIFLEIRDKGRGLGANRSANESNKSEELIEMGVGIPGMQQRLRQLGGRLEIDSNSEGTTITAVVPKSNEEAHDESSPRIAIT